MQFHGSNSETIASIPHSLGTPHGRVGRHAGCARHHRAQINTPNPDAVSKAWRHTDSLAWPPSEEQCRARRGLATHLEHDRSGGARARAGVSFALETWST